MLVVLEPLTANLGIKYNTVMVASVARTLARLNPPVTRAIRRGIGHRGTAFANSWPPSEEVGCLAPTGITKGRCRAAVGAGARANDPVG